MYKLLSAVLIICHISFGAEINIKRLSGAIANEEARSAIAEQTVASALEQLSKSTWASTIKIVPRNFVSISKAIAKMAAGLGGIVKSLKKYQAKPAKGTTYIPSSTFNAIENGFTNAIQVLQNIAVLNKQYYQQIEKNNIYEDSQGLIWLPQKHNKHGLLTIRTQTMQDYKSLVTICNKLQSVLKKAARYLSKNPDAEYIFQQAAYTFQINAADFGAISQIIANQIKNFNAIVLHNNRGQIAFPQQRVMQVFNSGFQAIGHEYSDMEKHLTEAQAVEAAQSSSSSRM